MASPRPARTRGLGAAGGRAVTLALAMLLDAAFGEPRWLWSRVQHPAVVMGNMIGWCDTNLNHGNRRKLRGILVMLGLVLLAWGIGVLLDTIPFNVVDLIVVAILIAQKSLVQHVKAVADNLRLSVNDGRRSVAMIVGRDTKQLDQSGVARGAIESAAENLSDGIIAPLFWYAVAGLPGILIYKITNTADSMIGYKTPKHRDFGWAAARFDDLLNLIPARLTAIFIWFTGPSPDTPAKIFAEAPKHRSPNAGWPEAAMAHRLDVALSGPRSYEGQTTNDPFVNPDGQRSLSATDIDRAVTILWAAWSVAFIAALGIALF